MSDDDGTVTPIRRRKTGAQRPRNTQRTTPEGLDRHARTQEALALRIAGASYREIGRRLGADPSTLCRDVVRALDRQEAASVDDLRIVEGERLDRLQAALWPDAVGASSGPDVRARAVNGVLRIMERRARLFGLDAPQQVTVTHEDTDAAIREAAEAVTRIVEGEVVTGGR